MYVWLISPDASSSEVAASTLEALAFTVASVVRSASPDAILAVSTVAVTPTEHVASRPESDAAITAIEVDGPETEVDAARSASEAAMGVNLAYVNERALLNAERSACSVTLPFFFSSKKCQNKNENNKT